MPFLVNGKMVVHGSPVFRSMIEKIKDDEDKIAAAAKEFSELRDYLFSLDPKERLGKVFDLMERNRRKLPVSCTAGCSHCCHMMVGISNEEADLLAAVAKRDRIRISREHLLQQAGLSEKEFWKAPKPVSRCVFLGKNGRCKVYRFRPRACRNHSAVSPPERCMEMPGEGRTIEVAADYRPEMISAAYSTVPGVSTGGMAEMLLPRLFHD